MKPFIIENVLLFGGDTGMRIIASDGRELRVDLEAGCCSHSFFDYDATMDVADCLGDELLEVSQCEALPDRVEYKDSDVEKFYGLYVKTNRHQFRIPFRNNSNGYYGGSAIIAWPKE